MHYVVHLVFDVPDLPCSFPGHDDNALSVVNVSKGICRLPPTEGLLVDFNNCLSSSWVVLIECSCKFP